MFSRGCCARNPCARQYAGSQDVAILEVVENDVLPVMVGADRGLKFKAHSTDMWVLRKKFEALPRAEIIALRLCLPKFVE